MLLVWKTLYWYRTSISFHLIVKNYRYLSQTKLYKLAYFLLDFSTALASYLCLSYVCLFYYVFVLFSLNFAEDDS